MKQFIGMYINGQQIYIHHSQISSITIGEDFFRFYLTSGEIYSVAKDDYSKEIVEEMLSWG